MSAHTSPSSKHSMHGKVRPQPPLPQEPSNWEIHNVTLDCLHEYLIDTKSRWKLSYKFCHLSSRSICEPPHLTSQLESITFCLFLRQERMLKSVITTTVWVAILKNFFSVSKGFWVLQAHAGSLGCTETLLALATSCCSLLRTLIFYSCLPIAKMTFFSFYPLALWTTVLLAFLPVSLHSASLLLDLLCPWTLNFRFVVL